ncbi:MAG: Ig domain-containing protein, partial [Gemmatimonadaceae bacterium]
MHDISAPARRIASTLLLLGIWPLLTVCSGATGTTIEAPPGSGGVAVVAVAPASTSIAVGTTATLSATLKDAQGNVVAGQSVSWSTSAESFAAVSANGVVTGIAPGSVTITAASSGKSGTASVTVTANQPPPPVVTTVTVSPPSASLIVGSTTTLSATIKDAQGNVMTNQTITWSSSNVSVATVTSSGV